MGIDRLQALIAEEAEGACWLFYCDHGSDPAFRKLFTGLTTAPALALVGSKSCHLVISSLEVENIQAPKGVEVGVYGKGTGLWDEAKLAIERLGYPTSLLLNYSRLGDPGTDHLKHGQYLLVTSKIRSTYGKLGKRPSFASAEHLLRALSERKDAKDHMRLRLAAATAAQSIEAAFSGFRPGMTELELAKEVRDHALGLEPSAFGDDVTGIALSWEADDCPIILAGENLVKGGHAIPSDRPILPGDTVYVDFGVKLSFADSDEWSSDIQRMGYVLKEGEVSAPADVQRVFHTLVEAIDLGIDAMRPGRPGYEIDRIVRGCVVAAGYPTYDHGTGHPVGRDAHDPGMLLAPKERARSRLKLQEGGTYTVEPRIAIPNGGSIEEMVVITSDGAESLSERQRSLYLLG